MDVKNKFHRKVLSNGMTILFEKRDLPIVSVAFAVRNGGVHESEDEKGISHFIEHMLYKGTPTRNSKQIAKEIEKNGGELNGFTSEQITAYWCKMPSRHLDVALEVLGDMVKNPLFDEKELEKERKVIFEEIKMRRDTPQIHVFDEIQGLLYEKPLGLNLIGSIETMNLIDRKKMVKKFKEIYTPNNLILCVVGDGDFDKIVDFAEKNFSEGVNGKVPQQKIVLKNAHSIDERVGIDQANLVFAFHIPKSFDKKVYAAEVLTTLLAGGMSSRLFSEIREKRNLAYAVKGDNSVSKDFAYGLIYVGTTKENLEVVKDLILKEIEDVSKNLGEDELNEVKDQLIGNYQISLEDSQSQLTNLLMSEYDGNVEEFYEFEEKIRNVKIDDVKSIASTVKDNFSFFALVPK